MQQAWSPLHIACHHATAETLHLLLRHGASAAAKAAPCGWTPAMVACCRSQPEGALAALQALEQHGGCKRLGKAIEDVSCMSLALLNSCKSSSTSSSSASKSNSNSRPGSSSSSHSSSSMPNSTSGESADGTNGASSSSGSDVTLQLLEWLVQHGAMPATMSIPAAQEVGRRLLLAGLAEQLLPMLRMADPAFAQGGL